MSKPKPSLARLAQSMDTANERLAKTAMKHLKVEAPKDLKAKLKRLSPCIRPRKTPSLKSSGRSLILPLAPEDV